MVILLECLLQRRCEFSFMRKQKRTLIISKSTEASFNGDSNEETLNVNKTCWQ